MEELNLELITRLPETKLPFIGIVFEIQSRGESLYKIWPESYGKDWYQLYFEAKENYLELIVKYGPTWNRCKYQIAKYDLIKLKTFIERTINSKQINFGHLSMREGQYKQLRTSVNRAPWLLGVNKIDFIEEH